MSGSLYMQTERIKNASSPLAEDATVDNPGRQAGRRPEPPVATAQPRTAMHTGHWLEMPLNGRFRLSTHCSHFPER